MRAHFVLFIGLYKRPYFQKHIVIYVVFFSWRTWQNERRFQGDVCGTQGHYIEGTAWNRLSQALFCLQWKWAIVCAFQREDKHMLCAWGLASQPWYSV